MSIAYHFVGDKLRDGLVVPPDGEWIGVYARFRSMGYGP